MVKLLNVLILSSGLTATAFSLERPVQRVVKSNKIAPSFSKQSARFQHNAPSFLMSSGEGAAGIIAAEKPVPPKPTTLIDKIWNENTKLAGNDRATLELLFGMNPLRTFHIL